MFTESGLTVSDLKNKKNPFTVRLQDKFGHRQQW